MGEASPASVGEVLMERLWLGLDDEPPGLWELDERLGLRTWRGPSSWSTRHGDAVVDWQLGRPVVIHGATTPEGPMRIETASPMDHATWRRRSSNLPGGWVHGTVEIFDEAVVFADVPHRFASPPPPVRPGSLPDLARDIASDGALLARLQDKTFARVLYVTLYNGSFRYGDHARRWCVSGREAGGLIAELREIGETYIDFYLDEWSLCQESGDLVVPYGQEAVFAEVVGHLSRIGWARMDSAGLAADHADAMVDLARAEARPGGSTPGWARGMGGGRRGTPTDRARTAAAAGKLSRDEFQSLIERFDFEAEQEAAMRLLSRTMTHDDGSPPRM